MDSMLEQLMKQLAGSGGLSQISQSIGADEQATGQAVSQAVPVLLSGLTRNSSQADGAEALHKALTKDHDGSILDDLPGFLGNPQSANGAGILRHVLGDQRGTVESGLAKNTGLDAGSIGKLLEIAAPLLMGMLGRTQRQQGLDPSGLASMLGGQQQMAEQSAPDLMGMLGGLLGGDQATGQGSGNILDSLGRLLGGNQ